MQYKNIIIYYNILFPRLFQGEKKGFNNLCINIPYIATNDSFQRYKIKNCVLIYYIQVKVQK